MRHILTLVIFVPMAVVVGIFAVENRQPLALELWPLSGVHQMWASVWVLGLLGAGILLGLAIGLLGVAGWRRRARRAERQNRHLEARINEQDTPLVPAKDPVPAQSPPGPATSLPRRILIED
tara:strand:+ start:204 stop:569 length:366 start_codon:yes stop_codon:yes gene_type:complete